MITPTKVEATGLLVGGERCTITESVGLHGSLGVGGVGGRTVARLCPHVGKCRSQNGTIQRLGALWVKEEKRAKRGK